jgi:predicted nuclease of predicted toxin-antitoxin system
MRILLDHCVPKRLRRLFPHHEVRTTREMGWGGLSNGKLLGEAAQNSFDVLLTVDQNIKHQQNLSKLPLAIIVLIAADNRFDTLSALADKVEATLQTLVPKTLVEIS